jgi:hypothetical protein
MLKKGKLAGEVMVLRLLITSDCSIKNSEAASQPLDALDFFIEQ